MVERSLLLVAARFATTVYSTNATRQPSSYSRSLSIGPKTVAFLPAVNTALPSSLTGCYTGSTSVTVLYGSGFPRLPLQRDKGYGLSQPRDRSHKAAWSAAGRARSSKKLVPPNKAGASRRVAPIPTRSYLKRLSTATSRMRALSFERSVDG